MQIIKPIRPDFVKCLQRFDGLTIAEIYQATKEVNAEHGFKEVAND